MERPAGHFDQGSSFWDKAESSHAQIRRKKWPLLTNPCLSVTSEQSFGLGENGGHRHLVEEGGTWLRQFRL